MVVSLDITNIMDFMSVCLGNASAFCNVMTAHYSTVAFFIDLKYVSWLCAIDLTNIHLFNLSDKPHFHKDIDWFISLAVYAVLCWQNANAQ